MNQKQRKRRKEGAKAHQKGRTSMFSPKHEEAREAQLAKKQLSKLNKKKKNKIGRIRKLVKIGVLSAAKGAALTMKIREKEA